jgi:hypothetical protein
MPEVVVAHVEGTRDHTDARKTGRIVGWFFIDMGTNNRNRRRCQPRGRPTGSTWLATYRR